MNPYAIFVLSIVLAAPVPKGTPVAPASAVVSLQAIAVAEGLLRESQKAYAEVHDYTAIFIKQERIANRLRKEDVIEMKFQKSFKIYLAWIESPDKGMEVIYKEGENDNKITAHLGGFLSNFVPTVNLDIRADLATRNNRHLITESGIGEFLKRYEADFKRGKEKQEMQVILHGEETIFGRPAHQLEAILPKTEKSGYYCYRSIVWFDAKNKLPIKMEFYDFTDTLMERYTYKDLKINLQLTAYDFDPQNSAYRF